MGPGGCNDCLAPAYGYVAVRCAAFAVIGVLAVNDSRRSDKSHSAI